MSDIDQIMDAAQPDATPPPDSSTINNETGKGTLTAVTRQRMTEEELLEYFHLDHRVWQIVEMSCKAWNGFYKRGVKGDESHKTVDLYSHSAKIRRRLPVALLSAIDSMVAEIPRLQCPSVLHAQKPDDLLYVMALFDVHFGKYCWMGDSSHDFDLEIADQVYRQAVIQLLSYVQPSSVSKIIFPIGQDFGHFDSTLHTTTKGTIIDYDTRWAKVYKTMKMAVLWAVQEASKVAPVEVRYSGGNHDRLVSYTLCELVESVFAHNPDVDVTQATDAHSRQYIRHGNTAIMVTHGDGLQVKNKDMPLVFARECKFWSECEHHEILTGHLHHQQVLERVGIVTRVLSSLSGTDWYHYHSGYVENRRCAQGLAYSADSGIDAIYYAKVKA